MRNEISYGLFTGIFFLKPAKIHQNKSGFFPQSQTVNMVEGSACFNKFFSLVFMYVVYAHNKIPSFIF